MAGRLNHLVAGQKRFLGDAAHELCAPLARLRTGLGILEMKLAESDRAGLIRIESEASELAMLVEKTLASLRKSFHDFSNPFTARTSSVTVIPAEAVLVWPS